jgi:hypothetical protein
MTVKPPTAAPHTADNTDLYGGIALGVAGAAVRVSSPRCFLRP